MSIKLIESEKTFKLAENSVYTIVSDRKINKIELKEILKKSGLSLKKIAKINSPSKSKRRGKKSKFVTIKRPSKFCVYLDSTQTIDAKKLEEINQSINLESKKVPAVTANKSK